MQNGFGLKGEVLTSLLVQTAVEGTMSLMDSGWIEILVMGSAEGLWKWKRERERAIEGVYVERDIETEIETEEKKREN